MKLLLTTGWKGNQELISENPTKAYIEQLVNSLNWQEFNSITLQKDDANWINVSGNLGEDGLAIVLEENGVNFISEVPPQTKKELSHVLQLYLKGDFNSNSLTSGYTENLLKRSEEFGLLKVQLAAKRKEEKRNRLIAFIFILIVTISAIYIGYLYYKDELKFIGHDTEIGVASVTEIRWVSARGRGFYQMVIFQFQYKNEIYSGVFRGDKFTGKHEVGDQIKIKYSTEDPTISKRLATNKRKHKFGGSKISQSIKLSSAIYLICSTYPSLLINNERPHLTPPFLSGRYDAFG